MKPIQFLKIYLARQYAKLFPREMFTIVTGSIGKTATTIFSRAVLSQKYKTLVIKPESGIFRLNPSFKKVILETELSQEEVDLCLSQIKPETVIFTRISYTESGYSGDLDAISKETEKLIASLGDKGTVLLNFDDPNNRKLAENCKSTVFYYGRDPQNCTVWAGNIRIENYNTTFELNLGVERVKVNLKLLGSYLVYPALAAATLGVVYKIPLTKIKIALESVEPLEHHLQVLTGPNASLLLDDSYNGTPFTIEGAIDTLLALPARRRVVVLGEMKELGKHSENLHRQIAQRVYKEKLDLVFLGQGDAQFIAEELESLGFWKERIDANLQNSQLVSKLLKTLGKGDICLIAGSQAVRLDEVVKRIVKKQ